MFAGGGVQGGMTPAKFTVTVKVHWLVPQALVATQVTTVVPYGKKLPEGGVELTRVPFDTCGGGYVTVVPLVVHHV
jgi:hypothetical protein